MKIFLTVCVVVALAGTAWADPPKKSFVATTKKGVKTDNTTPPITKGGEVRGAIPRGFRGGNPLQMLNPKAPAKYGTWVESTSFDPNVPGKWKGIKLFEILF
jgi:hypothetical protein